VGSRLAAIRQVLAPRPQAAGQPHVADVPADGLDRYTALGLPATMGATTGDLTMRSVAILVVCVQVCLAAFAADPAAKTPPALPLFDSKSFAEWEGNLQAFRIQDAAIVGGQLDKPVPRNEYLCTTRDLTIQILDDSPATCELAAPLIFSSFRGNGEDGLHLAWRQDGYTWTPLRKDEPLLHPEVGGRLMRDPQILQGPDGTFHMVWTTAWNKHGVGYANSRDLIHWSRQKLLDVMKNEPQARNVWAPEIYSDAALKQFMIFWASTIPGRFPAADKTGDDGYNHRIYFTVTSDLEQLEPAKLLYEPGFNVIDATIVQDGKRFLMFLKD
jgi:hypothetical protein